MPLTAPPAAPPAAPTAPGDAPSRANPTTFRALADAFVTWQVGFRTSIADLRSWLADYITWAGTHVSEMNSLQTDVTTKSSAATTAATTATAAAATAVAARDASVSMLLPSQGFTGAGPWTVTSGTVNTHLWTFIGPAFYHSSNFTQVGQVITPIAGKVPFVNSTTPVYHYYI